MSSYEKLTLMLSSTPGVVTFEYIDRHGVQRDSLEAGLVRARKSGLRVESVRGLGYRLVRG